MKWVCVNEINLVFPGLTQCQRNMSYQGTWKGAQEGANQHLLSWRQHPSI